MLTRTRYSIEVQRMNAQYYAAEVRERREQEHKCKHCEEAELLETVQRILERWRK